MCPSSVSSLIMSLILELDSHQCWVGYLHYLLKSDQGQSFLLNISPLFFHSTFFTSIVIVSLYFESVC